MSFSLKLTVGEIGEPDSCPIVGQPEVIQAASNRLNWRNIPITLIDPSQCLR
jgi:hypothetical protein